MSAPTPHEHASNAAVWRAPERVPSAERPDCWGWLTERGSLTARLAADLGAPVRVVRISEQLDPQSGALCRQARLDCAGAARVYAESRIPAGLLTRFGTGWPGDRPLGDSLFSSPGTIRRQLQVAHLPAQDPFVQRALKVAPGGPKAKLWARRSRLLLSGDIDAHTIIITECFV